LKGLQFAKMQASDVYKTTSSLEKAVAGGKQKAGSEFSVKVNQEAIIQMVRPPRGGRQAGAGSCGDASSAAGTPTPEKKLLQVIQQNAAVK